MRARLAARLGVPVRRDRAASVSRRRVARDASARRRRPRIIYALARPARTTSCSRCCSPPKRCGATARGGWCWSRPISATCGRTPRFIPAKRSARRSIGQLDREQLRPGHHRRCPSAPHRRSIGDVFPGIEADNLSAMPAIADACARPIDPRNRSWSGPTSESRPWVSDLAGRLGLRLRGCAERPAAATARSRSRLPSPQLFAGPAGAAGRRHRLLRRHADRLRAGARSPPAPTSVDAIITHALFPPEMVDDFTKRRHPLRPLHQQRAASHQCDRARRAVRRRACATRSSQTDRR